MSQQYSATQQLATLLQRVLEEQPMSNQYETPELASRLHHLTRLVYCGKGELTSVEIDGVMYEPTNLKEHQVLLERAAHYGHKVSMFLNKANEITKLLVIPMVEPTRSEPKHQVRK